jgi:hypothetical protein
MDSGSNKEIHERAAQIRFLGAAKGRGEEAQMRFPGTFAGVTWRQRVQSEST